MPSGGGAARAGSNLLGTNNAQRPVISGAGGCVWARESWWLVGRPRPPAPTQHPSGSWGQYQHPSPRGTIPVLLRDHIPTTAPPISTPPRRLAGPPEMPTWSWPALLSSQLPHVTWDEPKVLCSSPTPPGSPPLSALLLPDPPPPSPPPLSLHPLKPLRGGLTQAPHCHPPTVSMSPMGILVPVSARPFLLWPGRAGSSCTHSTPALGLPSGQST